jgi:predicted RNA-binding protein with PIN domain
MPYLVDGNNVMAQTAGWHRDKAAARRRLIHAIARFIAVQKVKVRVVFDGVPDDEFPEGLKFKSVHILYARLGSDADSRIKEIVRRSSYKRDLIVVSSDRDLASYVKSRGAKVISSGKFRALLEDAAKTGIPADKAGAQAIDVDEWLDYFNKPGE